VPFGSIIGLYLAVGSAAIAALVNAMLWRCSTAICVTARRALAASLWRSRPHGY